MANVRIDGLSKSYGPTVALKHLDLDVAAGEWVTLLGPSGCGKTTTLRMIAGFAAPTTGRITIGDRVVSDVDRRVMVPIERRRLGMVFQAYAVWPHMNVLENVAYPLKLRRVPARQWRESAMRALADVQMTELAERYPHELSGGQQQRVALARALVSEPDVLLLDEPLSALDARLRVELRSLLARLHKDTGLTVVFVTHDQEEATTLSDRIVVMHEGAVRQIGTARDVYHRPADEFVARFIGSGSVLPVTIEAGAVLLAGRPIGRTDRHDAEAVLIRPERVRIHDTGEITCRVTHSWFKGDHELIQLDTPAGELLARSDAPPSTETVQIDVEEYVLL
jgi:ABC-type Fe3+/spermidine/putrescine transport system ATPase subunit